MNSLYVFSGLGVDERVFSKIDFGQNKVNFVNWIEPQYNESITDYAKRLNVQITAINPILIGISFGGIIAQEIAKLIDYKKLIILASIESKSELPWYFKIICALKFDVLIPSFILKTQNFLTNWAFGISSKENENLLKAILIDTNPVFLKWAIRKILTWQQTEPLKNILKIHGTSDRILPIISGKKYNYSIKNGGHFFTLTHASEINDILKSELV
jgi:pimeloyl-ACP methyl ester carboxylesterase